MAASQRYPGPHGWDNSAPGFRVPVTYCYFSVRGGSNSTEKGFSALFRVFHPLPF